MTSAERREQAAPDTGRRTCGWTTTFGRPRLRFGGAGAFSLTAGFPRASMAVESRERWPTNWSPWVLRTSASCTRWGNCERANSAKAREKTDSLGAWLRRSQPQRRRSATSVSKRSSSARVVGMS